MMGEVCWYRLIKTWEKQDFLPKPTRFCNTNKLETNKEWRHSHFSFPCSHHLSCQSPCCCGSRTHGDVCLISNRRRSLKGCSSITVLWRIWSCKWGKPHTPSLVWFSGQWWTGICRKQATDRQVLLFSLLFVWANLVCIDLKALDSVF